MAINITDQSAYPSQGPNEARIVRAFLTTNPKWQRDELILALDLYLRHSASPPGKDSDEILDLSDTLNRLAEYLSIPHEGKIVDPEQ